MPVDSRPSQGVLVLHLDAGNGFGSSKTLGHSRGDSDALGFIRFTSMNNGVAIPISVVNKARQFCCHGFKACDAEGFLDAVSHADENVRSPAQKSFYIRISPWESVDRDREGQLLSPGFHWVHSHRQVLLHKSRIPGCLKLSEQIKTVGNENKPGCLWEVFVISAMSSS